MKKKRPGLTPELDLILDSVCVPVASAGPITGVTIQVARAQLKALLVVAKETMRDGAAASTCDCAAHMRMRRALGRLVGLSGQQGGRR